MSRREDLRRMLAASVAPRRAPRREDVRSGDEPDVQLIAGVGPYEVDVLIRVLPNERIEVVGQITGAERVHEPVPRLRLALYDTADLTCAARVETDPFGEFTIRNLPAARYALALGDARNAPCMLIYEGGVHATASDRPV